MPKNNLGQLMVNICSVPVGQIEYDETLELYQCRCGCGLKFSSYFLKNAFPIERAEAHRLHRLLSNMKGEKSNVHQN